MVVILRDRKSKTFVVRDNKTNSFGVNVSKNDNLIDVFQWAIKEFKRIKSDTGKSRYHLSVCGGGCNG